MLQKKHTFSLCPFCGSDNISHKSGELQARCSNCSARGPNSMLGRYHFDGRSGEAILQVLRDLPEDVREKLLDRIGFVPTSHICW